MQPISLDGKSMEPILHKHKQVDYFKTNFLSQEEKNEWLQYVHPNPHTANLRTFHTILQEIHACLRAGTLSEDAQILYENLKPYLDEKKPLRKRNDAPEP